MRVEPPEKRVFSGAPRHTANHAAGVGNADVSERFWKFEVGGNRGGEAEQRAGKAGEI